MQETKRIIVSPPIYRTLIVDLDDGFSRGK